MLKKRIASIEEFFIKLSRGLDRLEMAAVVIIMSSLLVLGGTQIILRKFFNTGVPDADILTRNMVTWLAMTGAALAAGEGRHISIDLTDNLLRSGILKNILKLFTYCVVIWVSFLFLQASYDYIIQESTSLFSVKVLGIPEWKFSLIFPIGFILIIFHYALRAFFIICDFILGRQAQIKEEGR